MRILIWERKSVIEVKNTGIMYMQETCIGIFQFLKKNNTRFGITQSSREREISKDNIEHIWSSHFSIKSFSQEETECHNEQFFNSKGLVIHSTSFSRPLLLQPCLSPLNRYIFLKSKKKKKKWQKLNRFTQPLAHNIFFASLWLLWVRKV